MPNMKNRKPVKKKSSKLKMKGYMTGGVVAEGALSRQTTGYGAAKKDKAGMNRDA